MWSHAVGARCSTDAALGASVCHSRQVILKDGETGCICNFVVSTAGLSSILHHSLSTTAHLSSRCYVVNYWLASGRTSALCGHTALMLRQCDPSLRLSVPLVGIISPNSGMSLWLSLQVLVSGVLCYSEPLGCLIFQGSALL